MRMRAFTAYSVGSQPLAPETQVKVGELSER